MSPLLHHFPIHTYIYKLEMLNMKICCLLRVLVVCMLWGQLVIAQDYEDDGGVVDAFAPNTVGEMVPAMYIFGDSLIDNGNNNDLTSFAKANYFPYGIDFNGGPTGRFSNGYTMVDEIGLSSLLKCVCVT